MDSSRLPPPPPPSTAAPDESARGPGPILVLAVLAFIPILGVFFGAVGLTWGLVSSRRRAMRMGLIAGAGAALNIIAVFALGIYGIRQSGTSMADVRTIAVQGDLLRLVHAIEDYRGEEGRYPASLSALRASRFDIRAPNIYDQFAGAFSPEPYRYVLARDGATYDLSSAGADREHGTADDVRPVLPDSLATRAGYAPPAGTVAPRPMPGDTSGPGQPGPGPRT